MSLPVSAHLTLSELACRDGQAYPLSEIDADDPQGRTWGETRLSRVADLFEACRRIGGDEPVMVDSGYRDFAYDAKLYAADAGAGNVATPQGSQHPKGRALDLKHSTLSPKEFHDRILRAYKAGDPIVDLLGGIGLYKAFVHVDCRPKDPPGHLAQWNGSRDTNIA